MGHYKLLPIDSPLSTVASSPSQFGGGSWWRTEYGFVIIVNDLKWLHQTIYISNFVSTELALLPFTPDPVATEAYEVFRGKRIRGSGDPLRNARYLGCNQSNNKPSQCEVSVMAIYWFV
jgi:hypothetical protein